MFSLLADPVDSLIAIASILVIGNERNRSRVWHKALPMKRRGHAGDLHSAQKAGRPVAPYYGGTHTPRWGVVK